MELFENIEKFAQGKLSNKEQLAFEKELASNDQLAVALTDFRKSQLAIKAAARQQLRQQVEKAYKAKKFQPHKRVLLMQRMAVAAGFLLLMAAGFWYINNSGNEISPDQLFAQYFEMPAASSVRSGNNQANEKWKQAIDFYAENNLNSAIPIFNELILDENFTEKETAKLLLGTSLLSINKPDEALIIFNKINTASSYQEDAAWYAALALLKVGKMEAAKLAFENIAGQKAHFKKEEANRILKDW